jgi:hypothetical protein
LKVRKRVFYVKGSLSKNNGGIIMASYIIKAAENTLMEGEMGKALRIAEWMRRGGFFLVASIIVLMGCQGSLLTYKGAKVRDAYLIALTEGTQRSAGYQSPDLTIEYQWARKGDELQLSGLVKFTPRIRNGFTMIPVFDLSLFFTDAQGNILEQRWIATPGSGDPESQMRISERLFLPPGTASMAFSYSGQARDSDGIGQNKSGGDMHFWQVPIVR